jgi:hypothetical protein
MNENATLAAYRAKAAAGTITKEELKDAIRILRENRFSSVQAAARRRTAAVQSTRTAEDLLQELEQ